MAAKLISIKEKKVIHKFICKYQIIILLKMKLYFIMRHLMKLWKLFTNLKQEELDKIIEFLQNMFIVRKEPSN